MRRTIGVILICIILSTLPVQGRTRLQSIENFINSRNISNDGFAEVNTNQVTITTSSQVLEIISKLDLDIENRYDILLFYQQSQNNDGGFGEFPNTNSSWISTVNAIKGLRYLSINGSQLANWQIFSFINSTSLDLLYENTTIFRLNELQSDTIDNWIQYITASSLLNIVPTVPLLTLVESLKNKQYPNGSYPSFEIAVKSIELLGLIGELPNDASLATMYILAYLQDDNLFSATQYGQSTLEDTYNALKALSVLMDILSFEYTSEIVNKILDLQKANTGFTNVGENDVSIDATYLAVNILAILGKLDELNTPDVLQEYGFISYNAIISISLTLLVVIRRRLHV